MTRDPKGDPKGDPGCDPGRDPGRDRDNTVGRAVRTSYAVAGLGGVAFFVLSIVLLGVWPGRALDREMRELAPDVPLGLSASEERGRGVFAREGCAYCHTQQVRFLEADITRYGAPTLAWETQVDYPHLWGTRRIGPDLARQSAVHSEDWHYAHLFAPRAVVPGSVMPAYQSLFDGTPLRPRQDARDLVAYLDTLGRARELAGPEGEARAKQRWDGNDAHMRGMAFVSPVNAHPARNRPAGKVPPIPTGADRDRGTRLYTARCSGCHGTTGAGDGPAATWLSPRPANLAAHVYTRARLVESLWRGVAGTSMPAWRDHTPADVASLAAAVEQMAVAEPPPDALPAGTLERGREVYAENCAQCHGDGGDGLGSAASEQRVAPTNFRRQRASADVTRDAIRRGVDGTSMGAWALRLSAEDVDAVAAYVRSLFTPGAQQEPAP